MAEPIVVANRWLTATLKAHTGVAAIVGARVYRSTLPSPPTYPLVLFEYRFGAPAIAHNGIWVMTTLTYRVRGIMIDPRPAGLTASEAAAIPGDLAAAIVAAIHRQGGAVTGGTVWSCQKVDDYERDETLPDKSFRHLGGEFELTCS